jgi:NAD(P)-dependent dehydrogenase (short-subunit alcohol dehydrogenase family)
VSALTGKSIVITGAARGLGAAYARHAASLGAGVVVSDIDAGAAKRTAAAINAAGGRAIAHGCNVSDWDAAGALIARCVEAFGTIDGLVNNAGILRPARLEDVAEADLQAMLGVNVVGAVACAHHAVQAMQKQGSGAIVNVTSGSQAGDLALSAYGATKGAVASATYSWAVELAESGIRVNAVSPLAATDMAAQNAHLLAEQNKLKPDALPLELPPADINAPLVSFLLSDAAQGINGQVVRIAGRALALVTHPAVMEPVLEREEWTFEAIRDAFRSTFADRLQPTGLARVSLSPARA